MSWAFTVRSAASISAALGGASPPGTLEATSWGALVRSATGAVGVGGSEGGGSPSSSWVGAVGGGGKGDGGGEEGEDFMIGVSAVDMNPSTLATTVKGE
jgi:hypothetical protein